MFNGVTFLALSHVKGPLPTMPAFTLPTGCIPIVCTPFHDDGAVDHVSLRREVDWLIEQGATGLVTPALASEGYKLTDSERDAVLATVTDQNAGRLPVIASVDATATAGSTDRAIRADALGATGLMTMPPSFIKPSPEQIVQFYRDVGAATSLPLILQDAPQITGVATTPAIWMEIASTVPTLAGLKLEAIPQGPSVSIATTIAPERLRVYSGWGGISVLDVLERGARGTMPAPGFTPLFAAIHRAWDEGDQATAETLHQQELPFLVWSMQTLDQSVFAAKHQFNRLGIFSSPHIRQPGTSFDRITHLQLRRYLDRKL